VRQTRPTSCLCVDPALPAKANEKVPNCCQTADLLSKLIGYLVGELCDRHPCWRRGEDGLPLFHARAKTRYSQSGLALAPRTETTSSPSSAGQTRTSAVLKPGNMSWANSTNMARKTPASSFNVKTPSTGLISPVL